MHINYAWVFAGVLACAREYVYACSTDMRTICHGYERVIRSELIKQRTNQNILGCEFVAVCQTVGYPV